MRILFLESEQGRPAFEEKLEECHKERVPFIMVFDSYKLAGQEIRPSPIHKWYPYTVKIQSEFIPIFVLFLALLGYQSGFQFRRTQFSIIEDPKTGEVKAEEFAVELKFSEQFPHPSKWDKLFKATMMYRGNSSK